MSYTVLARRYRPATFDDVVGQEAVAQTLKNAIAINRVAHAYLFSGTRGVGKTTMARVLAKALNCLAAQEATTEPCCQCESCLAVAEGEDLDVLEIDGASNTGVEHIRELRQNAIYRPARARFKVYIIDEVHMLSVSAFNALLKTLEEPPEHVKFILATTEPNKVLATILSRCQRFDFRNIQPEDIAGQLRRILASEQVPAEDALIRRVARLARGSMRDGLSLLDQILSMAEGELTLQMLSDLLGTPRSERVIDLVAAMAGSDLKNALDQVDAALAEGLALEQLVDALQAHFRDLLVLRNCGPETDLVDLPDQPTLDAAVEQSKQFDDAALVYNITVMEELRRAIKSGTSGRALLEAAVVRLAAAERFSDTKALLEQLQGLATGSPVKPTAPAAGRTARPAAGNRPTRPAAPGAHTPAPTPPAQPGPAELNLGYIQTNWADILQRAAEQGGKHIQTSLTHGHPTHWHAGILTVEYPPENGTLKMLAGRPAGLKQVGAILTKVLGHPVKLSLVESGNGAAPAAPTNNVPGAKPSQKEINAAVNDPTVRQVQEALGGKVKAVRRRKD